jgi:hypothetical protein
MNAQPLSVVPMAEGAMCQAHPNEPAEGACTRCGTFYCSADHRVVLGKPYCDTCAVHPEVDYLEGFRLKLWGKRDAWTWVIGFGAVVNLILGVSLLVLNPEEMLVQALFSLWAGGVGACFWLGMPWARGAFLFVPVGSVILGVMTTGPAAIAQGVVPMAIVVSIFNDTRNKLFFKQHVSMEALQKAWHLYMNNRVARAGFLLGILGVLVPGVGVIAIICSIIGLRRVDPNSHPPVGRKGQAIAGIVLGGLTVLGWGGVLVAALLKT